MSLEIREERHPRGLVLSPVGRIDSNTAGEVEKVLLAKSSEPKLVLDLSGVEYVSSAGLRVFLVLGRRVKGAGGRLVLCGLPPSVRQVFDLSGFTALFTVESALDPALARLSS